MAAIVGTWVAAGLRVQHVEGLAALSEIIRKAASAKKGAEPGKLDVNPAVEQNLQRLTTEAADEQIVMV